MVERLHAAASVMVPFDAAATERFLRSMVVYPSALLLVSECDGQPVGFIAGAIGFGSTSSVRVAVEHGWFAAPEAKGEGLKLLRAYEAWAKDNGCHYASMCSPPQSDGVGKILSRSGYRCTEFTWAKALQ